MKFAIYILLLLVCIMPILAVKPVPFVGTNTNGLIIEYPLREFVKVNSAYDMYFHVFNGTNVMPLTYSQVNCTIHLYNRSINNHLVEASLPYDVNNDFEYKVNSSLYNELGFFSYIVWCNSSNGQGGFVKNGFYVTSDGESFPADASNFLAIVIVLIPLFMAWLLFKWSDGLNAEQFALRFGINLLVLILPFVSLWLATMAVMKFFFWSNMVNALASITRVYGIVVLVLFIVLLILFIKSIFDGIAGKRRGDYVE